jgi:glycerol-3-phosphate O-acyltransferase / dihydroxyacetone phosphate acyltransferase
MWLQPVQSPLARRLTRVYHRLTVAGRAVPQTGPVLIVANHPNSLIDPAVVAGVACRPVRFLAKHTLFRGEFVSWIVRGAGSIPVYRQADGAGLMHQNQDAFESVFEALATGSAVGIFPEGLSHSESHLAPLKTGAARVALGAAHRLGSSFPIVPIGLTFERRDAFRSPGLVVIGSPVEWDDLASAGTADVGATQELTRRIDSALRLVTVNLERWEDAPLVHMAEAVFAVESAADPRPHARILRLKEITDRLSELRSRGGGAWETLARELTRHERILRKLRMRPADLQQRPGIAAVARWTGRTVPLIGFLGIFVVAIGSALFWPPYKLVGMVVARARPVRDVRSTYKLIVGVVLFTLWWALLIAAAWWWQGWIAAAGVAVGLPLLGVLTLELQERWGSAIDDAYRFVVHRTRPRTVAQLAERQRTLAARLHRLYDSGSTAEIGNSPLAVKMDSPSVGAAAAIGGRPASASSSSQPVESRSTLDATE